jgi:hypothetical protein
MQYLPALIVFHHKVREMLTPPVTYWLFYVGFFSVLFGLSARLIRKNRSFRVRRRSVSFKKIDDPRNLQGR